MARYNSLKWKLERLFGKLEYPNILIALFIWIGVLFHAFFYIEAKRLNQETIYINNKIKIKQ
jgi:hypothetical protein